MEQRFPAIEAADLTRAQLMNGFMKTRDDIAQFLTGDLKVRAFSMKKKRKPKAAGEEDMAVADEPFKPMKIKSETEQPDCHFVYP